MVDGYVNKEIPFSNKKRDEKEEYTCNVWMFSFVILYIKSYPQNDWLYLGT